MEKIKDFFLDFFKDPREEALSDQWNEHIRLINKAAKEREEKYKEIKTPFGLFKPLLRRETGV